MTNVSDITAEVVTKLRTVWREGKGGMTWTPRRYAAIAFVLGCGFGGAIGWLL